MDQGSPIPPGTSKQGNPEQQCSKREAFSSSSSFAPTSISSTSNLETLGTAESPETVQNSSEAPDSDVSSNQEFYVFFGATAKKSAEWSDPYTKIAGNPDSLTVKLDQAPAAFNTPCRLKKMFRPPFSLKVTAKYSAPVDFSCKARCYMLTEQQFGNVATWHPEVHGDEELLSDGEVHGEVRAEVPEDGGNCEVTTELEFTNLKFVQPTRMSKRYALFLVEFSFGAVVSVVYLKPTLVVSRSIDQYNKAVLILKDIRPMDGRRLRGKTSMTGAAAAAASTEAAVMALKKRSSPHDSTDETTSQYFTPSMATDYIVAKCREARLVRIFSDKEITFLLLTAGFTPYAMLAENDVGAAVQFQPISGDRWDLFVNWFETEVLPSILTVQQLWDQTSPPAICPLSVTREISEDILRHAPAGTFCVRPRLKLRNPFSWVISCNNASASGGPVQHILLTSRHLDMHSLEVWVRDLQHLQYCVDITNGKLVHKEYLFLKNYLRMDRPLGTSDDVEQHISPAQSLADGASIPANEIKELMGPSYSPSVRSPVQRLSQNPLGHHHPSQQGSIDLSSLMLDVDLNQLSDL